MEAVEKLKSDLDVLEAMAAEMDEYLRSDVLFWPMREGDMPRLTLGSYLMREHRLLELRDLLSMPERERLHKAIQEYHEALEEKVVRFEEHAYKELDARIRQWQEYLNEVKRGASIDYYASAVDTRAMLEALIAQLRVAPYRLEQRIPQQVALLDRELSRTWQPDGFVWPTEWQPAYPRDRYWWLYGHPRKEET
jgi:hypothetical protein